MQTNDDMNCKHCGNTLANDTKLCHTCGKPVEGEKLERDTPDIEYFSIPLRRLAFLSVLTLGLYEIFWFYKNWQAIKSAEGQKIYPFWRAIFAVFFCYGLFKKVLESAKSHNYRESFSPGGLAAVYICILLVSSGMSKIESYDIGFNILWLVITVTTFIPLLSVQKAINFNNEKLKGDNVLKPGFSGGEVTLIVIGVIWFILVLIGTFLP